MQVDLCAKVAEHHCKEPLRISVSLAILASPCLARNANPSAAKLGPGLDVTLAFVFTKVLCPTHYQSQSWLPGKKCRSQSERTAENQCDECNAGYVLNQEVAFAKGLGVGPLLGLLWLGTWPVREVLPGRLHLLQVLVQHWSGTSFLV